MAARERILNNIIYRYVFGCFNVKNLNQVNFYSLFQDSNRLRRGYLNIICTFDIETTTLDCDNSIMYIWQFYVAGYVIVGRSWQEFKLLIERINSALRRCRLKIFVHNLSYEFQFLSGVLKFLDNHVAIIKKRKIMSARYKRVEFVCSYLLSNMSLERFCQSLGALNKSSGLLDYSVKRYPHTILTWREIYYCLEDVVCLADAIRKQNILYHDDLSSMPYTSTGYVRRECRQNLRKARDYSYEECAPNADVFECLRAAFRGGNTHANRLYTGKIIKNVGCYDISSAYPAAMLQPFFPVGAVSLLHKRGNMDMKSRVNMLVKKYCVLFRAEISNVELKVEEEPIPYLAAHKCAGIIRGVYDNGRVLACDKALICVTELDWEIICRQYKFDYEIVGDVYYWRKGYLPESYIETVIDYYFSKTQLKDGDKYLYGKSKNKLNALYGMMVQNPAGCQISWRKNDYYPNSETPEEEIITKTMQELLDEYASRAVMDYQKGVWVTAICRWYLQQAIDRAGEQIVYCDTDSIKYIGELDLRDLKLLKGYSAFDKKGIERPIGIFEFEEENFAKRFVTWGAKKYAFEDMEGNLHITVAGVVKSLGARELARKGGLEAFKPGFVWKKAGGKELVYNDKPNVNCIMQGDFIYPVSRNVAMYDSTYTLTVTPEYAAAFNRVQKTH